MRTPSRGSFLISKEKADSIEEYEDTVGEVEVDMIEPSVVIFESGG